MTTPPREDESLIQLGKRLIREEVIFNQGRQSIIAEIEKWIDKLSLDWENELERLRRLGIIFKAKLSSEEVINLQDSLTWTTDMLVIKSKLDLLQSLKSQRKE